MRRKNAGCVKNLIYTKFTQCKFGAKKCKLRLNQALEFTTPCTLACKCGIYHLCPWFPPNLHFFARIQLFVQVEQFVRFFGNKVKYTLAKRKEVCMNGLQSKMAFANYLEFLEVYRGVAKIFSEVIIQFSKCPCYFCKWQLRSLDHRDVLRFVSRIFRNVQYMFQKTNNMTYTRFLCLWPECIQNKKKATVLDSSKKKCQMIKLVLYQSSINSWTAFEVLESRRCFIWQYWEN